MSFFLGFGDELLKLGAGKLLLKPGFKSAKSLKRGITPSAMEHHEKMRESLGTITKSAGPVDVVKKFIEIAKRDPAAAKSIAKEMVSGRGSDTAKGLLYGATGYSGLRGLTYKDPKTKRREPLEGAVRGAGKGALVGLPLALLWRYPAFRRAVSAHAAKARM